MRLFAEHRKARTGEGKCCEERESPKKKRKRDGEKEEGGDRRFELQLNEDLCLLAKLAEKITIVEELFKITVFFYQFRGFRNMGGIAPVSHAYFSADETDAMLPL